MVVYMEFHFLLEAGQSVKVRAVEAGRTGSSTGRGPSVQSHA